jgi:hypothetical protein
MGMKQSVCNPECKTEPYNNVTMNPINILFEISILKTAISKSTPPKTFHMVKKNSRKTACVCGVFKFSILHIKTRCQSRALQKLHITFSLGG